MKISMGLLLSVTVGNMMVKDIREMYKFYEWYSGAPVWTHQLPRLYDQTHEAIKAQHPFTKGIDSSSINHDNWEAVLADLIAKHGDEFDISRPLLDKHLHRDPIGEAVEIVGEEKDIKAN